MDTALLTSAFVDQRTNLRDLILSGDAVGTAAARALSDATDDWLIAMWEACADGLDAGLVAVGGYGRRELALHSDLDLILHIVDPTDPAVRVAVERFVTQTREARVKLAHAVRSSAQFQAELDADLRTPIAYLDARALNDFDAQDLARRAALHLRSTDDGVGAVTQLLGGFKQRSERFGQTVYRLEPDLKSGPGGLRDGHSVRWAAKIRFGFDAATQTSIAEGWGEQERADLCAGEAWLLTVRQRLHALRGRKHDRFAFDDQEAVALAMTPNMDVQEAVEVMMQEHYRVAKRTTHLAERALRRWSQRAIPFATVGSRFRVDETQITLNNDTPMTMEHTFEALRLASKHAVLLEPALEMAMERSLNAWSDEDASSPEACRSLVGLLTDVRATSRTSTRLLDLGILARIVPEFLPIVCHVQHDVYHVYTTDVHSVLCLEAGRSLLSDAPDSCATNWPWLREVVSQITDTQVFLLSCLFHDIGKNRGGGHSERGARMMLDIGPRLGLNDAQTQRLSFLVLEHLTLSQTARRRDISDSNLIDSLAGLVKTKDQLDLLLCLTFCDSFTVGDGVMTDWSASLLHELYHRVLERLEGREDAGGHTLSAALSLGGGAAAEAFVSQMPESLLSLAPDALQRYFEIYQRSSKQAQTVVEFASDSATRSTEVVVATSDQPGLLASIAGALAANGLDILAAEIISTPNGTTLDVFRVSRSHGIIDDPRVLARTTETLTQVLSGELDVAQVLRSRHAERRLPLKARPSVEVSVDIIEGPQDTTILEVRGPDRPGLLFDVASAIQEQGGNISRSFIDSEGDQVVDTFYVERIGGGRLTQPEIQAMSAKLVSALSD